MRGGRRRGSWPTRSRRGGRLYRTGDLVRAVSGSGFEFVGRADGQLKVRGFRVEPAEVENALLHHSRVDAAAVGLRDVGDGVRALVGYIQADGQVSQRELIEHLRGRLPAYMIPSRFVTATALPRTTSGKVDAQALAALELPAAPGRPAAGAAPEDVITAIWQRVLGHDEFDAEDDFFDVGGDSMLATWVVTELAQELGAAVSLSVFLDYSTVAGLAAALEVDHASGPQRSRSSQLVTLRPGPSARSLYLIHPLGGELIGYRELARASRAPFRLLGVAWQARHHRSASAWRTSRGPMSSSCAASSRTARTCWRAGRSVACSATKWRGSCAPLARQSTCSA